MRKIKINKLIQVNLIGLFKAYRKRWSFINCLKIYINAKIDSTTVILIHPIKMQHKNSIFNSKFKRLCQSYRKCFKNLVEVKLLSKTCFADLKWCLPDKSILQLCKYFLFLKAWERKRNILIWICLSAISHKRLIDKIT